MTIRFRIIIYYSTLLILIIGLFGAAVYGIMKWTMLNQTDVDLNEVLDDVMGKQNENVTATLSEIGGQQELNIQLSGLDEFRSHGVYVQIWDLRDEPELFSASDNISSFEDPLDPTALGENEVIYSTVTINGTHLRVLTRPILVDGEVYASVQAATTLTTVEEASDRLLKIMLGGGLIALVLSLMMGDWLARRVLAPVESIVRAAQGITAADDLGRRIPYNGPQDELGLMVNAFNETLTRLEKLFHVQRRFVGDVSHELRTPLTTLQGNLDLARLYGLDNKSMQAMESEVKRMTRIVGDLLLLAQADSGQLPLSKEPLDLDQIVLETYNEAILLDKGKHPVKLGEFDQVRIFGDVDRLKQLFTNLVTNALKYTPDGKSVSLSLVRRGDEAHVIVEDHGMGIPEKDLEHIFERFYRVDKARSRAAGGTGLGLSIAEWIAEAHQGRIQVESIFGEGTTFTVILPVYKGELVSENPANGREARKTAPAY